MDFTTFFDIYMRPRTRNLLKRDGIEFRYAAASIMIACSKADMDEAPEEKSLIKRVLIETFGIGEPTIDRLLEFADAGSEESYLSDIVGLVNDQFSDRDKRFLLEKLWQVAYADGRIEDEEQAFIDRVASEISMGDDDIADAKAIAQHLR